MSNIYSWNNHGLNDPSQLKIMSFRKGISMKIKQILSVLMAIFIYPCIYLHYLTPNIFADSVTPDILEKEMYLPKLWRNSLGFRFLGIKTFEPRFFVSNNIQRVAKSLPWIGAILSCLSVFTCIASILVVFFVIDETLVESFTYPPYLSLMFGLIETFSVLGFSVSLISLISKYKPKIVKHHQC